MATISFIGNTAAVSIANLSGSGIGFYGTDGFGSSVAVGTYQGHTFITSSDGTSLGPELANTFFLNSASGVLGQASSGIAITAFPNYQVPLNIRFTHTSAVKLQNCKLMVFDRISIANTSSGVTTKLAQIIHPTTTQVNNGSGSSSWTTFLSTGAPTTLSLVGSPGSGGLSPGGINTVDSQHDFYIAASASPDSIGSKSQYSLYCYVEYL